MFTRTLLSIAMAAALTGCSPFSDDDDAPAETVVENSAGTTSVAGTLAAGSTLTANIVDADGFDPDTVTYTWMRDGVAIPNASGGSAFSTYTLPADYAGGTITVATYYTDNAGNVEGTAPATVDPVESSPNQVASITDTDSSDTGELRYKLDTAQAEGKLSLSVLYPEGETEAFYISLFNDKNSTGSLIAGLRLVEGEFYLRQNAEGVVIPNSTGFTPGEFVDIEMTWNTTDPANASYTVMIDGTDYGSFPAELVTNSSKGVVGDPTGPVTAVSLRLSSNAATTVYAVEVDDIAVYSDAAGSSTPVHSDDFESYSVGEDLDDNGTYNSSSAEAVVAESSITASDSTPTASPTTTTTTNADGSIVTTTTNAAGVVTETITAVTTTADDVTTTVVTTVDASGASKRVATTVTAADGSITRTTVIPTVDADGAAVTRTIVESIDPNTGVVSPVSDETTSPVVVTTPNKVASITDTDESDTGELRYKFDSAQAEGKLSLSVLYPVGEEESFYISLFNEKNSTGSLIAGLKMDSGKFSLRQDVDATAYSFPSSSDFVPGEFVDIVMTWNATSYTVMIDGVAYGNNGTFPAELVTSSSKGVVGDPTGPVTAVSLRLSSNSATTTYAVEVDDIAIYSDQAGSSTAFFSDDFESYDIGHDLDDNGTYNSSTAEAVVAESSLATN